jgi:hypothetical protein
MPTSLHGIPFGRSIAASLTLALGACTTRLPAPERPERIVPVVRAPSKPPLDNHGRVAIDVVEGHAVVELIEGRSSLSATSAYGETAYGVGFITRRLCTTPCSIDLPLGEHELRLRTPGSDRTGLVAVVVEEEPSALRVDLGWRKPAHQGELAGGSVLFTLGLIAALTGIPFLIAGDEDERDVALGLTLGGSAALGLGLYLTIDSGGEIRPSSMVQWRLPSDSVGAEPITDVTY